MMEGSLLLPTVRALSLLYMLVLDKYIDYVCPSHILLCILMWHALVVLINTTEKYFPIPDTYII